MASSTEPNSGIVYGWTLGESNWNTGMDANLLSIGRVLGQCSIIDRDLNIPPLSATDGDRYIVGPSPTGLWVAHANKIAVWNGVTWTLYAPSEGWLVYIQDEQKISVYKTATQWSAGIAI